MNRGILHLVPTLLGASDAANVVPAGVRERVCTLRYFIVEDPKRARAFLHALAHPTPMAALRIETLTADTAPAALETLLRPVLDGEDGGLLSDAGAPAIADPGAALVRRAHASGIRVLPMVGPSAILLALMASGLEGQRFAFHGYLPIEAPALIARLKSLEAASRRAQQTEIFIETPHRNDRLLRTIAQTCAPDTLLCVAADLTLPGELIATRPIADWRRELPTLGRRPAVFLLLAAVKSPQDRHGD